MVDIQLGAGYTSASPLPEVKLSVGTKCMTYGFNAHQPAFNNPQFWNWHVSSPGCWTDDSPVGDLQTTDSNVGAEESPDSFKFYYNPSVAKNELSIHPLLPVDLDDDKLGDLWEIYWEATTGSILDRLFDLDGDDLSNLDEFRWQLIPVCVPALGITNCMDKESDSWLDGQEVPYWNDPSNDNMLFVNPRILLNDLSRPNGLTEVANDLDLALWRSLYFQQNYGTPLLTFFNERGISLIDPDAKLDTDYDGVRNVDDADSDNDGAYDGPEVLTYASYPEFYDSDCKYRATLCTLSSESWYWDSGRQGEPGTGDGIRDGLEISKWNSISPGLWGADSDSDSVPNLLDVDSDEDNLTDHKELVALNMWTRGDLADTDGDTLCDGGDGLQCTHDGPQSPGEYLGWDIVALGLVTHVTSNPTLQDTDSEGLADGVEYFVYTDPTDPDTDGDALNDFLENPDSNFLTDEGETDPLNPDTDADGVPDGIELLTLESDPLLTDSDDDGMLDGSEYTAATSLINEDSDNDYASDAEDTAPFSSDRDGDGLLDGEEIYFYETDVAKQDTDCDGQMDGADPNPWKSNLPPGRILTAANQQTCDQGGTPVVAPGSSAFTNVGLIIADSESITILAREPPSETPVETMAALVSFTATIRTSTAGATVSEKAMVHVELTRLDEDIAQDSAFTWAVRVPAPMGVVSASSATVSLTIMDQNLNAAVYSGSIFGLIIDERTFAPYSSIHSGDFDYGRETETGTTGGAPGMGMAAGEFDSPSVQVFQIFEPGAPFLAGALLDNVITLQAPDGTTPAQFLFFTNAIMPADESDSSFAAAFGIWGKIKKTFVEVTTVTWTAIVTVTSTVTKVVGKVAGDVLEETKQAAIAVVDEVTEPKSVAGMAARFAIDIVGIGDMIDIGYGLATGDWALVAFGVAGLALSAATILTGGAAGPLDMALTGAKTAYRAARVAGASDGLIKIGAKHLADAADEINAAVRAGDNAGAAVKAATVNRVSDAIRTAPTDPGGTKGLAALLNVEGAATTGAKKLGDIRVQAKMLGKEVDDVAAEQLARETGPLLLKQASEASGKLSKVAATQESNFRSAVKAAGDRNLPGTDELLQTIKKSAGRSQEGHVYQLRKAVDDPQAVEIGRKQMVQIEFPIGSGQLITRELDMDYVKRLPNGKEIMVEIKDTTYLAKSSRIAKQILKMEKHGKEALNNMDEGWMIVKNGQVSEPLKQFAGSRGVKIYNDSMSCLNCAYYVPWG